MKHDIFLKKGILQIIVHEQNHYTQYHSTQPPKAHSKVHRNPGINPIQQLHSLLPHPPLHLLPLLALHDLGEPHDDAVAHVPPVGLLAGERARRQAPRPDLGRPRQQLQPDFDDDRQREGDIAEQRRRAETRVQRRHLHPPLAGRVRRDGHLTRQDHLHQLGRVVPVRQALIGVEGLVNVFLIAFVEFGLPGHELRHVHRNRALPPLGVDPLARRDARVQYRVVQPRQLVRARRELFDALKRRLVQRPHLDDAAPARRQLNVRLGRLAFVGAAHGEDHLGGIEPHKVPRRFEAQADVGARDDDGAAGAVVGWVGELFELGADEIYCHHLGGFFAGLFFLY
ncbi:hypothetical protein Landi51_02409 [Colletotrichum acutatum]